MTRTIFPAGRPVVCLAPMAGFSDRTFRLLCLERGADMVTSEMISAKGLLFMSRKTRALYLPQEGDAPYCVQLFGNEPETLAKAVSIVEQDLGETLLSIDLNMGCPAPKIAGNGDGSALMRDPAFAGEIVAATAQAAHVPVSVKFRKGWDAAHENAEAFARVCEENGAAFLTIHGRTREQMYSGAADRGCMARVKQAVSLPVIVNGDICSIEDSAQALEQSGADGLMIGRGAYGRPWLLAQVMHWLRTGEDLADPALDQQLDLILEHYQWMLELYGRETGVRMARKHLGWYTRGLPGSANFRNMVNFVDDADEVMRRLSEFYAPFLQRQAA